MTWKAVWVKDFDDADYASSFVLTRGWRLNLTEREFYSVTRNINRNCRWNWTLLGPNGVISTGLPWDTAEEAKADAERHLEMEKNRNV